MIQACTVTLFCLFTLLFFLLYLSFSDVPITLENTKSKFTSHQIMLSSKRIFTLQVLKKNIYHWWGFLSWVFCFSHSDCGKALIFNIQHNCDILKWLYLTKHLNYLSLSLFKKYYTQITNGFSFFFIWCRTIIWTFWNGLISWPTDILFLKDAKTS